MAEMGNIRPVGPVFPRRPPGRVRPGERRPDPGNQQRRPPQQGEHERQHERDDDHESHIDEYA